MISKDQKENIIFTIDESGDTVYDRHTAQHPAAVIAIKFNLLHKRFNVIRNLAVACNCGIL